MNEDILQGKWHELKGGVKEQWGKLTDDDLERVGGKSEQVIGLLQAKYGYTRAHAEEEFKKRVDAAEVGKTDKNTVPMP